MTEVPHQRTSPDRRFRPLRHGTPAGYRRKCRCVMCVTAYREYNNRIKAQQRARAKALGRDSKKR